MVYSGIDSSRDCSLVDCVMVDFDSGRVVPGLIQFGTGCTWTDTVRDKVLRVLHLLQV